MKNKSKLIMLSIVVAIFIFSIGIWTNTKQIQHTAYKNQENQSIEEAEEYEMPNFEEYLGEDINLLKAVDAKELKALYEKIVEKEKEENYDEADQLWDQFDDTLRDAGIAVPFKDFFGFAESIKNKLKEEDFNKINKVYGEIEKLNEHLETLEENNKKATEEKIEKLWNQVEEILNPLGYDLDELLDHVENKNILIALYDVKNGQINYKPINNHTIKDLSKEDIKKHKMIWERVKKIIPQSYLERIINFEINTDGKEEVFAHVNSPDESNKIWRLAVDIKDAIGKEGKLVKEFDKTLIHEFGHILTLNDSQMMKERNENSPTYTTEEGTTKKESYLNQFYNQFWKGIYKEWEKADQSEVDEYGENQALIDFYEKHKNEYVSDYASTNIEEDIAESFMQFVVENKPKGDTVAEQKILFFYQFKELRKIREDIRLNLK
ncbi:hypothetical protein [Crassaminicella profunda]|uniref:hypothetical protein n=1 Tax=Crassaminicella profunda TaxID=1286698 RepID=UPI001CA6B390|nr:hypothetical protein [Crassaminicella profunda]QZY53665.1 hypothetical protein K7H06_11390 [Crassaminicella profunda]